MSQADKNQVRQLKIKTGSLNRCVKDYKSYQKEETQLNDKLQKMIEEGKDEYDIKKMQEQVAETSQTLATCKPRIQNALDDLENLKATYDELPDGETKQALMEVPEWAASETAIAEAKAFLEGLDI